MDDIRPPQKRPTTTSPQHLITAPVEPPQDLLEQPEPQPLLEEPKHSRKKRIWMVIIGIILLLVVAVIGCIVWYQMQLKPLSPSDTSKSVVKIETGSSPAQIGQMLEDKKLIRSSTAFDIYTRLTRTQGALQAGVYNLSPSESTPQIVDHLTSGKTDEFALTFLPGATLAENRTALIKSGFAEADVDAALNKTYDHPIFDSRPASADLEGYIYGETYHFETGVTVEQVLERTFDEFYEVIKANDLAEDYKKQGLSLYEGITLASIIQREVSGVGDQKQVAQVFYKRLHEDMPLGADATFVYGAKKLGVPPSVELDSPYNTRIHTGLPPGPISSPGATALQAVATPAKGDYLYFVSGDDGTNYFSRTQEEHEAKTHEFCRINCSLF